MSDKTPKTPAPLESLEGIHPVSRKIIALATPKGARLFLCVIAAILVLSIILGFFNPPKKLKPWEISGLHAVSYTIIGLIGYVGFVLSGKLLRPFIERREDYYGEDPEALSVEPAATERADD